MMFKQLLQRLAVIRLSNAPLPILFYFLNSGKLGGSNAWPDDIIPLILASRQRR